MQEQNLLEQLVAISPGMEIWWDASPIVFENWCRKLLDKAEPGDRETLRRQFVRMYDRAHPHDQLFRGVTTNPILSMAAIDDDEPSWRIAAREIVKGNEIVDKEALFWLLYKEVVRRGSEMFLPLFEASGYKEGYISAQVDPRKSYDGQVMLEQAIELRAINPNVMIKVPGTREGFEVLEELTAQGISTNNTLDFILPQLMDGAETVKRGLEKAKASGVDLSKWRSVISDLMGRYGDLGGLRDFGKEKGIDLSDGDVRTAEIAIMKKAYRLMKESDYPSKLLPCAFRMGPVVDGQLRVWHLEEMTGANVVATCNPAFIDEVLNVPQAESIRLAEGRIDVDPPQKVMDKLLRIPFFERAYEIDGYARDEYNTHPSVARTVEDFSRATNRMVDFAGSCLAGPGSV